MSPLVLHVPHASTRLPEADLTDFIPPAAVLRRELLRLTDWYADELFASGFPPERVIRADVSRLVVDVERFAEDPQEPASRVGMGATYVRTTDGELLRALSPARRQELMEQYYWPHHRALNHVAGEILAEHGRCLILDAHTYPSVALPTQRDFGPAPEIGLGTDAYHTSPGLVDFSVEFFRRQGFEVAVDVPFRGTMVPAAFLGQEPRVQSLMVEVRRDLYLEESSGQRGRGFARIQALLSEFRDRLVDFSRG